MLNNLSLVLLLLLFTVFLVHIIKYYQTEHFSTNVDQNISNLDNIKFQKIIDKWNCNNSTKANNIITNSEQFTINLKLKLNEILNDNIYYCLFTSVDNSNCCGFPNLWIKNNNLHIKSQNNKEYKTLKYQLDQNIDYDIYLTYNNNLLQIRLYNNNQFSNFIFTNVKSSKANNIHIGKIGNNRIDAVISINYLPHNLNIVDITNIVNNSIKCGVDDNLSNNIINNFKLITNNSNCQQTSFFQSVLDKTNQFTISVIMDVIDYNDTFEYQRLFNGGNTDTSQRTPGVWINQGYLHIRASTDKNSNEGTNCWKIEPILQKGVHYHMILVYDKKLITVYINENFVVSCPTDGNILFYPDLHVGKSKYERKGANINLSIAYLPQALDKNIIKKEWMEIRNIHYSKNFGVKQQYSPFKIDCAGNDIQPYFGIDLNQCKEHCTKNEKCKGVSYNSNQKICVTKHSNCQCPGKDQNGFIYHRKGAEICDANQTSQYTEFEKDCPGNDLKFFDNVDLDQCKRNCDQDPKCKGVSYNKAIRRCYTKYDNCPCPGTHQNGYIYYRKGSEPCAVTQPGQYAQYKLDCTGNNIQDYFNISLEDCKKKCDQDQRCKGVSYRPDSRICVTKHSTCPCPGKDVNGHIFYRKGSEPCDIKQTSQYARFEKDCPGNDLQMFNNVDLDQCKQKCDQDQRCKGVSYHPGIRRCYTKYNNCPCPGTHQNGYIYHRKGSEKCNNN